MLNFSLRFSIVAIALGMVIVSTAHTVAETPVVANKIENAIRSTKPEWRCSKGIFNGPPPLVRGQRTLLVEACDYTSESGKREGVDIMIFQVDNGTDAKMSLLPVREGRVARGWKVERFSIGDEGYLSTFKNGRRFEIHFRKGTIVVSIGSDSFPIVDRFAHLVAAQIDPTS